MRLMWLDATADIVYLTWTSNSAWKLIRGNTLVLFIYYNALEWESSSL